MTQKRSARQAQAGEPAIAGAQDRAGEAVSIRGVKERCKRASAPSADEGAAALGRGAANVMKRRRQIIDAARRLLVERPEAFSMRNVATEASVSVFTVYNLVGRQSDLIAAVVDAPAHDLIVQLRRKPYQSPLKQLLREISRFDRQWKDDSKDMLAVVRALRYLQDGALMAWFHQALAMNMFPLINAAVEAGELRDQPSAETLIDLVTAVYAQSAQNWSAGLETFSQSKHRMLSSLVIVILAAVKEEYRGPWEKLSRQFAPVTPR